MTYADYLGAVPSLTAKAQNRIDIEKLYTDGPGFAFRGDLIQCLDQKHTISIIMALGKAQRAQGRAIVSDVLKQSECIKRARYQRLLDLIECGIVSEVKTTNRQHNIKPIELTALGWMIYSALDELSKVKA